MKKITFLMLHLNYGGIEKQVTTLANNLIDEYDIEIISLYDILGKSFYELDKRIKVRYIFPYGPNKKELKEAIKKVKIIDFLKELKKSIKMIYTKYFGIRKITKDLQTDILISTRIEFARQIKRNDIITVSQEHSYINTKRYASKVRHSFKNIRYLVVMTKKAAKVYEEWLQSKAKRPKIIVIPNMINKTDEISSLNSKQIVSAGRLEDVKDFPSLIKVFERVHKKHNDWKLKIIGDGSKKEELKKLISDLKLEEAVLLKGRLDEKEIIDEFCDSSIFVLTSKSESFSLVIAEAMSCALPCVSFDIDVGPREIITDNEDGFLIAERSVIKMEEKINLLIESTVRRHEMGENARKNAARFYPDSIKQMWLSLLK